MMIMVTCVITTFIIVVIGRLLRSNAIQLALIVSLCQIRVYVLDELVDSLAIVCSELFNIVMSGTIDIVWRILMSSLPVKLLSVIEWHDFVSLTMDYVDWTIDVWHAIDVRELVKRQCPAKIEDDTEC